jgi:DNA-binding PadR family transcriptional regulator
MSQVIRMYPPRFWKRHTAAVPKGFLRNYVLKLLNEKPMSGSEIIQEIEKQTEGHWKPSPGSIYPLLIWLQNRGYIKEASKQEAGMKHYTLTDQGKALFEGHSDKNHGFPEGFQFFAPPIWFQFYPERAQELREATRKLVLAVWNLRDRLQQEYSETEASKAKEALEEAAQKIENITKKPKGAKK